MKIIALLLVSSLLLLGCIGGQPATPTAAPTVLATPEPTAQATAVATVEATPEPTVEPSPAPTDVSTAPVREIALVGTTNGGTKWEWIPSEITAKKGELVRLKISVPAGDKKHGIGLPDFGVSQEIEAGEEVVVEFVASKAGSFAFSCNVLCGSGHGGMRGTLIVTE